MKGKKILLLFLALLFPVCIFLFLKIFGKNQFEVALLYQDGKIEGAPYCEFSYSIPYVLPDSFMHRLASAHNASLYVIIFSENDLNSIRDQFSPDEVEIKKATTLASSASDVNFLKDCVVLLKEPANIVLIDRQKRIRGYYDGNKRDDVDRLSVELNIMLKKY